MSESEQTGFDKVMSAMRMIARLDELVWKIRTAEDAGEILLSVRAVQEQAPLVKELITEGISQA